MAELPVNQLLTVAQAIAIIDATPVHLRATGIPLNQGLGLRLAADVLADRDDPPFDKSLMDGYAVRCGGSATLRIVGNIAAGATAQRGIVPGEAMAIMTGAPLPAGADAVVPIEQTSRDGDSVRLDTVPAPGQSIAPQASDCAAGAIVLRRGTVLGPAQIAVAAAMGAATVEVFARPRVAVLGTGNEIVAFDQHPGSAQIRNSNSPMLLALLAQLGCEVHDLDIVADEPGLIRAKLEEGMNFDVLFVTGGMSMGEYDYVPRLLAEMGVELRICKLRIKPGKPFVFGVRGAPHVHAGLPLADKFVFGLPGNPVSGYVCTLRLASRLVARMSGGKPAQPLTATLRHPLPKNGPREFYQPAILNSENEIAPLSWKGSADIYTLAAGNALIIREENASPAGLGTPVKYLLMP
jgi:molybdopterin molybdotransferase